MFVRSQQRIGFYATTKVKAQEELLFDYAYKKAKNGAFLFKAEFHVDWMEPNKSTKTKSKSTKSPSPKKRKGTK